MVFEWKPIVETDTILTQLLICGHELSAAGVTGMAYHITPPFHSQVSKYSSVYHYGYPINLVDKYLEPTVMENDPIPDYILNIGRTVTWKQAISALKLNKNQIMYLKECKKIGIIDGVGIPLFGPNSQDSYLGLNFGREISSEDEPLIRSLVGFAQSAHRRICLIIERDSKKKAKLSERETEVLYWMAHGKSKSDIAQILQISSNTTDTYVRRIYAKLEVNDRVSAVVLGLNQRIIMYS